MKIRLIPHEDHMDAVKKLYGKTLTPVKSTVTIQEGEETWTLRLGEWEVVEETDE